MIVYLAVLCTVLAGVAQRGAKMIASLAALNLGATPFQVGLLAALFPIFPLLLAVYAGRFSDRIGVRVPMIGGSVIMALGLCIPLAWPGMGGLLAVVALAAPVILLAYPRMVPQRTAHSRQAGGRSLELLAISGLRRTLVMSGVTLTGVELFTFYFPVYGRSIGLSASMIGIVMSSYAVAAFIVRMGMSRATRSLGEIGVLTASLLVAGATYMLVPLVSHAMLLSIVAFLLGIGLGCAQPLTIILTYNHAPKGRSGEALGMRLTVNKLIQILVPLVFGAMGSAFGLIPVFWANGLFLLGGGAVSLAERKVSLGGGSAAITGPQEEEK